MNAFFRNLGTVAALLGGGFVAEAGERTDVLQKRLAGSDRILLESVVPKSIQGWKEAVEISGKEKVELLVKSLDFVDEESGFHCMCAGDSTVTFFKGEENIATLSHHHGWSLRWREGDWDEDSQFSPEAAKAWRNWFQAEGVSRFQDDYLWKLKTENREKKFHAEFLSLFPEGAGEVFEEAEKANLTNDFYSSLWSRLEKELGPAELSIRLMALFSDRDELAMTLAQSLEKLSSRPAGKRWGYSSIRELLVVDCARSLTDAEFSHLLASGDDRALHGAARLFFQEGLDRKIEKRERASAAAMLGRGVFRKDVARNADIVVAALGDYPGEETSELLKEVASGTLAVVDPRTRKGEPQIRVEALLTLAGMDSQLALATLKNMEGLPETSPVDEAALGIVRSLGGERGRIYSDIFQLDSSIKYAAINALVKQGDKEALRVLVEGGVGDGWPGASIASIKAVEEISGLRFRRDSAGMEEWEVENQDYELYKTYAKEIQSWWRESGENFQVP